MKKIVFNIQQEDVGKRLDIVLANNLEGMTRSQIKKIFDKSQVLLEDKEAKASYTVKFDDEITIFIEDAITYDLEPIDLGIEVVYEDDDVAVINKPQGLVVHPSVSFKEKTLINGLKFLFKNNLSTINGDLRPGIVHRIDKDTSGLLMIAKNDFAHESLVKQLQGRTIKRIYEAICYGEFKEASGTISAPIGRDEVNRLKMAVNDYGKDAVTHFTILERFNNFTFIECVLETGRTHQIRVHMSYINHPLVGDTVYGPKKAIGHTGQYLHAKVIGFNHPRTGEFMSFERERPTEFTELLNKLRNETLEK